jgi:citrate synthase
VTWLTATEALQVLHVRPQTLYANVSRNKIRAKPDPKDTRRSLYHEVDVRKLARKQGGRRKAALVASGAIEWGDPVLSSSISTVVDERLYYRGKDAVDLSEVATLEEVAGLLWGAEAVDFERAWRAPSAAVESELVRGARGKSIGTPLQRAFYALGQRASADLSSYGRALPILQAEAAGVFVTLASAMLGPEGASRAGVRLSQRGRGGNHATLHERVANAFGRPSAADVLRRVLILVADHELNASTFATRVAVSTGAPLSAGVLSGLATLSGPLHGRAALGVLELLASVERFGADVAVRDWLSQGRPIVGFGHPLYPAGDPRAAALLPQLT